MAIIPSWRRCIKFSYGTLTMEATQNCCHLPRVPTLCAFLSSSISWQSAASGYMFHDDVIKWKHFPRYWPFVWRIHRSPVNSPHKGQWRGALMFTLICARINGWVNCREVGDLRRHRAHYDVIVMFCEIDIHVYYSMYTQNISVVWNIYIQLKHAHINCVHTCEHV